MAIYYCDEPNTEESLEHHGIIGIKWGVRRYQNPDGSLTPEGRERYYGKTGTTEFVGMMRDMQQPKRKGPFVVSWTQQTAKNRLLNSPQLKNVAAAARKLYKDRRNAVEESHKIESQFFERKDYNKWVRKAAEERWNEVKSEPGWTFDKLLDWYMNDDGDQGERTTHSFDVWLKQSGDPQAKKYLKLEKEYSRINKEYRSLCEKMIKEFLGDYGEETASITNPYFKTTYQIPFTTIGTNLVDQIQTAWSNFENDFNPGSVPIEDLMRLAI